ncbi:MAG: hypothetical protein ACD_70C00128G0003 [uncultured bacterium]|nr:MAG: hypothetical protein ACD_70C00128G0003 [uncultured bacterium]
MVYNISPDAKQFPSGLNQTIKSQYEGWNSWGVRGYHPPDSSATMVTVYAIDRRLEATHLTGDTLAQKIQGHVISKASSSY